MIDMLPPNNILQEGLSAVKTLPRISDIYKGNFVSDYCTTNEHLKRVNQRGQH